MNPADRDPAPAPAHPTFATAVRFWLKLGFISFGGPGGQIAIMHAELVEKKKWISEARFFHALNYCMLLPGPEAQQLAIYIGWLLHRTRGGLVAGALFVLPSAFILWALSWGYMVFGHIAGVAAVFYGLKPAVLAIVAAAVLRIGRKALKNEVLWTLAGLAFVAIFFFHTPFPVILIAAAVVGFLGGKWRRDKFLVRHSHGPGTGGAVIGDEAAAPAHTRPALARALRVLATGLALWWLPVLALGAWLGRGHTIFREAVFFSKAALVTFGGAYAVLPYVSQQAVEAHGWLSAGQMLDGLGLAETTPGPLIMVLQFVGFLGAWQQPGALPPLLAATLGAAVTTWTTFVPCFLWIFLGAPHLEQLRGNEKLASVLSAITAAVVGGILNLAVWFGLGVLWPAPATVDWFAGAVATVAFTGMVKCGWGVIPVVAGGGAAGLLFRLLS